METKTKEGFAEFGRRVVVIVAEGRWIACSVTTLVVVLPAEEEEDDGER